MNIEPFQAGMIQFDVKLGDIDSNLEIVAAYLRVSADQGVKLAVLPEMWSCGFDNDHLAAHATQTPQLLEILSQKARQYHLMIAGSLPEASGNSIFNTLYLTDADGSLAGAYRKVHLFRLTEEPKYFVGGRRNVVCDTSIGRIGLMICYDLRFPELCRAIALNGAEIVIVSAQWPRTRIRHWDVLVPARAIENQLFMIAVNRCGADPTIAYGGHSQIVSPTGNRLAMLEFNPGVADAAIDINEIAEFRNKIPCLSDRVPEAY